MKRSWGVVLPVLLAGAVLLAVLIAFADVAPERGGAIARIADDPASFDGRRMTVSGVVTETPASLPSPARGAFVLEGPAGDRLLVLPADGVAAPAAGSEVDVRGVVRAPERVVEERRRERPPVTRPDLLGRADALAYVEQAHVADAGEGGG